MDLYSPKDKILLKNCIVIKLKYLELAAGKTNENVPETENEISYYSNIYEILKSDNTELLISTIKDSIDKQLFVEFNKNILTKPAKDLAEEHVNLTKNLMKENNVFSEEKFEELKKAFYKENEYLIPEKKSDEYEEEPEIINTNHLTNDMQNCLDNLNHLIRRFNPKTMSISDFKQFAEQLKNLTFDLGKQKFQQYFDTQNQTIKDMKISYSTTKMQKPVFKTDFTLLDSDSGQSNLIIEESASNSGFTSTYYQNLCYTYLEANKYSFIDDDLLDTNMIYNTTHNFKECCKKLEDMATKCKITISNNSIFYSSESEIEPSELNLEACNSKSNDTEHEI